MDLDLPSFDGLVVSYMRIDTTRKIESFLEKLNAANASKETIKRWLDPLREQLERLSPEPATKPSVNQKAAVFNVASKMKGFGKRG